MTAPKLSVQKQGIEIPYPALYWRVKDMTILSPASGECIMPLFRAGSKEDKAKRTMVRMRKGGLRLSPITEEDFTFSH